MSTAPGYGDAPPAYPDLGAGQGADAPPAYAPSYEGPGPQAAAAPISSMPMTAQLSGASPAAPPAGAVQAQPVVYMMQQPNGQLVPVQMAGGVPQQQAQQQQVVYMQQPMQQQVVYQQQPMQVVNANGITSVAAGTTAVTQVAAYSGPGEPNVQTVNVQFQPPTPDPFNRRWLSWSLLFVIIIFITQLYATGADTFSYYTYEYSSSSYDTHIWWRHDKVVVFYDNDYYTDDTTSADYDEYCDISDDYCDYESGGGAAWAFLWIANVLGLCALVLLTNVLAKCCACAEQGIKNSIRVSKVCAFLCSLSCFIGLISWTSIDPCDDYDYDGDCTWGASTVILLAGGLVWLAAFGMLFIK